MTVEDKIIFAVGSFAFLLLLSGVLYTILEFRKFSKLSVRFKDEPESSSITGKKTHEVKSVIKG
jgi:hypothetical protein